MRKNALEVNLDGQETVQGEALRGRGGTKMSRWVEYSKHPRNGQPIGGYHRTERGRLETTRRQNGRGEEGGRDQCGQDNFAANVGACGFCLEG